MTLEEIERQLDQLEATYHDKQRKVDIAIRDALCDMAIAWAQYDIKRKRLMEELRNACGSATNETAATH